MKETFPQWAPQAVIDAYHRCSLVFEGSVENQTDQRLSTLRLRRETFHELITHDNMMEVWPKLLKHKSKQFDRAVIFEDGTLDFATAVWRARAQIPPFERLTRKQRKELEKKLISNLNETALDLLDFGLDSRVSSLLPHPENLKLTPPTIQNLNISDLMFNMAKTIKELSPRKDSLLYKPGGKNADLHYFVKFLVAHNWNKYRKPLHEVVVHTADTFFPEAELTIDRIKTLAKTVPKKGG